MTASSTYARIVRVKIEVGTSGGFFASSPDLKGLLAASASRKELEETLIPQYIAALFKAAGQPVAVSRMEDHSDDAQPWVAVPLEAARKAIRIAEAA